MEPLLSIENLAVEFNTDRGIVRAVDDVSFGVSKGETLGIVGESGCGKTVTALSVLGLIPSPPGRIVSGAIRFKGKNLLDYNDVEMRKIRGKEIAMIFQEPMTALDPVYRIENQMVDVLRRHRGLSRRDASKEAVRLLELVSIPAPEKRIRNYPHQLSGGMRQRVMIAMALSCSPDLLIADEPTTALDVTTQAQVLDQINLLQKKLGMAVILVTHDLGVIAETCKKVIVMYCGKVIEAGPVEEIFENPKHPYTKGLLESIPRIRETKLEQLPVIEGMVPDLMHLPKGCRFVDRCFKASDHCSESIPELTSKSVESAVACFNPNE